MKNLETFSVQRKFPSLQILGLESFGKFPLSFQNGKFPFWKLPRTYWKFPSPFLEGLEVSSGREKVSIFTRVYCSSVYHSVDSYTVEYCRINRVLDLSGVYWRSVNTSSVIYDGNFLQIWKLSLGSFWKFLEVSKPKSRAWKFRSPTIDARVHPYAA